QNPFLRHLGKDEDFREQRQNRPQVQFLRGLHRSSTDLMFQLDLPTAQQGDIDEDWIVSEY
ncbi:MAG: hypothetical protein WB608_19290, partial [Terracidiphilus sp.]